MSEHVCMCGCWGCARAHACERPVLGEGLSHSPDGTGAGEASVGFSWSPWTLWLSLGPVCLLDSLPLPTRGLDEDNHSLLSCWLSSEHPEAHHGQEAGSHQLVPLTYRCLQPSQVPQPCTSVVAGPSPEPSPISCHCLSQSCHSLKRCSFICPLIKISFISLLVPTEPPLVLLVG